MFSSRPLLPLTKGQSRHTGWFLAAFCTTLLFGGGRLARADVANGLIVFEKDITGAFLPSKFPFEDYGTTIPASAVGAGFLTSRTSHGPLVSKSFPSAPPPFFQSTSSTGDTETSSDSAFMGVIGAVIFIGGQNGLTQSDSQAASSGGLEHQGVSSAKVSAVKNLEVTRLTTQGLAPDPTFFLAITAPAAAVHLKTVEEGNALASSSVTVSVVGTVQNLTQPSQAAEDLPSMDILRNVIIGNSEWFSPGVTGDIALQLPPWTRLTEAHFNLNLGLQVQMNTLALVNAVPEPTSFVPLLAGSGALLVRRRSRLR